MLPSWRFIVVVLLGLGSIWDIPSRRGIPSSWVCRFALAAWGAKMLLEHMVEDEEHEADDRLHTGKCLKCGYDLRSTPNRCPECGTDVRTALDEYVPEDLD